MRCYTIGDGIVEDGVIIGRTSLPAYPNLKFAAVILGEEGPGRKQEVILATTDVIVHRYEETKITQWWLLGREQPDPPMAYGQSIEPGMSIVWEPWTSVDESLVRYGIARLPVGEHVLRADLDRGVHGHWILDVEEPDASQAEVLIVFRTPVGWGGSNLHTGDRAGWRCVCGMSADTGEIPPACPRVTAMEWHGMSSRFAPLPGRVIAEGRIAVGYNGENGAGSHIALVAPVGAIIRQAITGRRFGKPTAYYYRVCENSIEMATAEQRVKVEVSW